MGTSGFVRYNPLHAPMSQRYYVLSEKLIPVNIIIAQAIANNINMINLLSPKNVLPYEFKYSEFQQRKISAKNSFSYR